MRHRAILPKGIFSVAVGVAAVVALSPAAAYGQFAAQGSFERTLSVTGPVDLEVTTGSGSIDVRAGEAGSVRVKGTIRARRGWLGGREAQEKVRYLEVNPPIEQNGNRIRIGHIADPEFRRNVSISYELIVPVETRLRADTGSGNQTIEGIRGPVYADTGSGNLRISQIGSEVEADTGSGDIELSDIKGDLRADTGSGSIRGTGIGGGITADTGSGDVRLEQTAPGDVQVDTGSGSVQLRGVRGALQVDTGSGDISVEGEPTGAWKLDASSGSITLHVPAQAAFDLHAQTGSGSIYSDLPITVQGAIGRRELHGQVRGGGVRIEAATGSGDIRIGPGAGPL